MVFLKRSLWLCRLTDWGEARKANGHGTARDWARNGGVIGNDGTSRGDDIVRGGQIQYRFWRLSQHDLLKIIRNKLRRKKKSRMIPTFVA